MNLKQKLSDKTEGGGLAILPESYIANRVGRFWEIDLLQNLNVGCFRKVWNAWKRLCAYFNFFLPLSNSKVKKNIIYSRTPEIETADLSQSQAIYDTPVSICLNLTPVSICLNFRLIVY